MKKTIYLTTVFLILSISVNYGQQLAHRSPFGATDFHFNPALTAVGNFAEYGINYRQQWSDFAYAPETASAYIQFPFVNNNMSVGGFLEQDNVGPFSRLNIALSYSYKIPAGRHGQLSIGIDANLNQYSINESDIISTDPNDALFFSETKSGLTPDFNFGIFYINDAGAYDLKYNAFFVGIGTNQLLPSKIDFENNGSINLARVAHVNAIIGGRLINNLGYIEPSIWIDYSFENIMHATANVIFEMEDTFWTGVSLSTDKSAILQVGYPMPLAGGQLRIGAMGVYNLGSLAQQQGLGFEFLVAYRFGL